MKARLAAIHGLIDISFLETMHIQPSVQFPERKT